MSRHKLTRRDFLKLSLGTGALAAWGAGALSGCQSAAAPPQASITQVGQMPNMPAPYALRDWRRTAQQFDALAFDFERQGEFLPGSVSVPRLARISSGLWSST